MDSIRAFYATRVILKTSFEEKRIVSQNDEALGDPNQSWAEFANGSFCEQDILTFYVEN